MSNDPIFSISPIDGRYHSKTEKLSKYFSEFGLMKYRTKVEIEYFIALNTFLDEPFPEEIIVSLRNIYSHFSEQDCKRIKEIEKTTNHDVKAVEYFLKEKCQSIISDSHLERIHFGLTSQDINNTAIPMSLKDAIQNSLYISIKDISSRLEVLSVQWRDIPMLARTHGQPASPTRLGKEFDVFRERIYRQVLQMKSSLDGLTVKFGGASGNLNAHQVAYPMKNWTAFADQFSLDILGIQRSQATTQINHYDELAAIFDSFRRINVILMDLCRDIWTYISMDYFKQRVTATEVGSSAMPHKVNPIDFENAEGNLGFANAIFDHMSNKLPVSRLQRDLTDSTVLRNIGVPFAHSLVAYESLLRGLSKVELNEERLKSDLENNWAVVAEGIQTILRREGYPKPYEALKSFSRGKTSLGKDDFKLFIDRLEISDPLKQELHYITPFNFTGIPLASNNWNLPDSI